MLKIGIIGSGFGTIGLLPAFASIKGCEVVGVCTGRKNWRAFLERNWIGAVAIAVPPRAQYEIAKAAIARGLHVFAEKPLAANLAQARELYTLAKKKRVVTGIDFIFPEIAEWKKVKELLNKKKFGTLKHILVNWNWLSGDIKHGRETWRTKVSEGGGALSFYFSHGLYYLEHFASKISEAKVKFIHSLKSLNGGEVGFDMHLEFKSGAEGSVFLSCNTPGIPRHRLVFTCERGTIILENQNAVVDNFAVTICDKKGARVLKIKKDKGQKGEDERVKIVRKLAKKFVSACGGGKEMRPSFQDGLRVQELIEKIRRGARR